MPSLAKRSKSSLVVPSLRQTLRAMDEEDNGVPLQGYDRNGMWVSQGAGLDLNLYYPVNSELTAYSSAMTGELPYAWRVALDTFLTGMKAGTNIWSKLDLLYLNHAIDSQMCKLNMKAPATFPLVFNGSPVFTAKRSLAGDGVGAYCTTGWIPSSSGVNYTRDSATLFAYCRTAGASAGNAPLIGQATGGNFRLCPRNATNFLQYTINDATVRGPANADGTGFYAVSRTASNVSQPYKDGVAQGAPAANASTTLPTGQINLFRVNSLFFNGECAMFGAGAGLNATEHATLSSLSTALLAALV